MLRVHKGARGWGKSRRSPSWKIPYFLAIMCFIYFFSMWKPFAATIFLCGVFFHHVEDFCYIFLLMCFFRYIFLPVLALFGSWGPFYTCPAPNRTKISAGAHACIIAYYMERRSCVWSITSIVCF